MQDIPSVNLADFLSGDETRKQKFINEIGKAFQEIGFVALKGHFLSDELVSSLYGEIKNFFELPVETKRSMKLKELVDNAVIFLLEKKLLKEKKKEI